MRDEQVFLLALPLSHCHVRILPNPRSRVDLDQVLVTRDFQHGLLVDDRIRVRLNQLSARLGDADWLDGAFSSGKLLMVSVLLRLKSSGLTDEYPNLAAYVARGEARPAYQRAFDAQLAVNAGKPSSVQTP
jgi:glutathione S-transferase